MRVDKYLWSVRYYKTRSIATQACKKGAVRINDAAVKPSRDVYPGDNVTLRKNQINYSLRVIEVPKSRVGPKLVDLYRVDTTPKEAFQQQELLKYSKEYYRKRGMGRPTKKDRRDIEDYIKEEE
ncbi:RNA-binding S4 domain-containing protein [Flavobacteriaceae bacterium]|jgi:ribosome-associated heat shock protein Hsp15|nr:RNA-binding S4 domain-containing protein [Bacteroidota bacterium]MDA9239096.1 RNA-binding S4 domain-containing protein [Flavobacteriaceae bacterium]MDA9372707.1 RNA-binding S4 domain-containing protein [Flavobacteriaceae bacterium]MDC1363092.1 RNA-binding S4 domain-containing protein [Flavobacteriaceae bacterium]MDG1269220.1 RNA-binding S4 domain-containing protein [Ulvibacter sp.]